MKRRLFITAAVVLVLSLVAYGTIAYVTGSAVARNIITAGNVDIALIDQTRTEGTDPSNPSAPNVAPFPEGGLKIMPGSLASKEVAVENTGKNPCWVRIWLDVEAFGSDEEPLEGAVPLSLNFNEENGWFKGQDGYYYYRTPLVPGEKSNFLFTQVSFSGAMGNEYQGALIEIRVTAQAVQSQNTGGDVLDAPWSALEPTPATTATTEAS